MISVPSNSRRQVAPAAGHRGGLRERPLDAPVVRQIHRPPGGIRESGAISSAGVTLVEQPVPVEGHDGSHSIPDRLNRSHATSSSGGATRDDAARDDATRVFAPRDGATRVCAPTIFGDAARFSDSTCHSDSAGAFARATNLAGASPSDWRNAAASSRLSTGTGSGTGASLAANSQRRGD